MYLDFINDKYAFIVIHVTLTYLFSQIVIHICEQTLYPIAVYRLIAIAIPNYNVCGYMFRNISRIRYLIIDVLSKIQYYQYIY